MFTLHIAIKNPTFPSQNPMNRSIAFLVFFSIVLGIYFLVNLYIYWRGLQALPTGSALRPWYQWGFWVVAGMFILGRTLEKVSLGLASDVFVWAGSLWLAAMLYFFLLVVLIDMLRLIHHFIPFFPGWITANMEKTRLFLLWGSLVLVGFVVLGGFINARNPRVKTLEIHIPKKAEGINTLQAVVMSDIHLGTLVGNRLFNRVAEKVKALSPDIILLPGDILDEDLQPVLRQNIGNTLRQLRAPMGVFAVMGNHEHIGGASKAVEYLESHGITMLQDSVVKIKNSFFLVGREDHDKARLGGNPRASLDSLMKLVDPDFPIILMDHQPFHLEESALLGVDLQLSGHTHHGQLWPLQLLTKARYTISRGYGKFGDMHAYVSNGVGTWGPPVRVGNRPEILHLLIHFNEE